MQHEPLARQAGLSTSQLAIIRDVSIVPATGQGISRDARIGLSDLQTAALVFTDHSTRSVAVPQGVFDGLWSELRNEQQMLEVTATIAAYNMVSRILVALDVGGQTEVDVPFPGRE